MAISKPLLLPKKGYVEVEVNGVRKYRNAETGVLLEDEVAQSETEPSTEDVLNVLLGVETNE